MMPNLTEELSGKIYDHLILHCGADPYQYADFVAAFTRTEHVPKEWRFCGHYGLAGKFWWNNDKFYVSGYSRCEVDEDQYEEQEAELAPINEYFLTVYQEYLDDRG